MANKIITSLIVVLILFSMFAKVSTMLQSEKRRRSIERVEAMEREMSAIREDMKKCYQSGKELNFDDYRRRIETAFSRFEDASESDQLLGLVSMKLSLHMMEMGEEVQRALKKSAEITWVALAEKRNYREAKAVFDTIIEKSENVNLAIKRMPETAEKILDKNGVSENNKEAFMRGMEAEMGRVSEYRSGIFNARIQQGRIWLEMIRKIESLDGQWGVSDDGELILPDEKSLAFMNTRMKKNAVLEKTINGLVLKMLQVQQG